MASRRRVAPALAAPLALLAACGSGAAGPGTGSGTDVARGKGIYETRCAPCHGIGGGGDGPAAAAIQPQPRDLRDPAFLNGRTRREPPLAGWPGRDLGERLAAAIADELAEGPGPVLVIGADAPHVPAAPLAEAAAALAGRADVVLGPAADGGYYLIGIRGPAPDLFAGIAWSTAGVLAATRAQAEAAGLAVHLLPPGFDVDEVADLVRLRALLARGEVRLPRTTEVLAVLALRS